MLHKSTTVGSVYETFNSGKRDLTDLHLVLVLGSRIDPKQTGQIIIKFNYTLFNLRS